MVGFVTKCMIKKLVRLGQKYIPSVADCEAVRRHVCIYNWPQSDLGRNFSSYEDHVVTVPLVFNFYVYAKVYFCCNLSYLKSQYVLRDLSFNLLTLFQHGKNFWPSASFTFVTTSNQSPIRTVSQTSRITICNLNWIGIN